MFFDMLTSQVVIEIVTHGWIQKGTCTRPQHYEKNCQHYDGEARLELVPCGRLHWREESSVVIRMNIVGIMR